MPFARDQRDGGPGDDAMLVLAYRALELKDVRRAGWAMRGVSDPESVADHSWGTALLCLLFAASAGVDRDRAVAMAIVHDLAEVETGDIVARADESDRQISVSDKARLEHEAMERLLPDAASSLRELWLAYENRDGLVADFVRDMNLIDMCLQALYYQERGRHDAAVELLSSGGFKGLDEFFAAAQLKLSTPVGLSLFSRVAEKYRALTGD